MLACKRLVGLASLAVGFLGATAPADGGPMGQQIVVANRGAGSISVIDVASSGVTTFALPGGEDRPEPMYVVYSPRNDLVFVGDRGNDRVVAFNARTYDLVASDIAAGDGIFHMWGSPAANQLWVNNERSRSISVISMTSFRNLATISTPNDLGPDARPHDVILDPSGRFAYVTIIGAAGPSDFVIRYRTASFAAVDRQAVGKEPHVSLTARTNLLYVPTQDSDQLSILNRTTLNHAVRPLPLFHAHGIAPAASGWILYLTSFPGTAPRTGLNGLHVFDTRTNRFFNTVHTPDAGSGPHNIALSTDNTRLYITHSGATSTTVSVFDISGRRRTSPRFLATLTVGTNPFGIVTVPAALRRRP